MKKYHICLGIALLLSTAACESLEEGLSKAVLMDYDRINNFRGYEFQQGTAINWGGGTSEYGIYGWATETDTKGFWVTFLICNLRNEGSQAQPFTLDLSKFYVEFDGEEHYYKPLDAYTYTSIPNGLPGNNNVTPIVNQHFRSETQIGPNTTTFQQGFYPSVNYRLAIYVKKTSSGPVDINQELMLRYKGYPNILSARNQPPLVMEKSKKNNLMTICRPPLE